MNFEKSVLGLAAFLSILITRAHGTAKLMLRFEQFSNPGSRNYFGGCCDGEVRGDSCSEECDYSINICLKRSLNDSCSLGTFTVGSIDANNNSFVFPSTFINGLANPVPLSLDIWKGNIVVEINMMDEDTQREEMVDKYILEFTDSSPVRERRLLDDDFTPWELLGQRQIRPSSLNVSLAVRCDTFYYNNDCSVNCVGVDSCEGHYSCNAVTGDKLCLPGWAGNNCSIPVSQEHGCRADQVCDNNALCVRWGQGAGQFYCCCEPGFTGENCETDIDECVSNPCNNGGSCVQGSPGTFQCECTERFKGHTCQEQKTCADKPCLNGGECISILDNTFYCLCNENYTGVVCDTLLFTTTTTLSSTTSTTTKNVTTSSVCPVNYYGPNCATYCVATDSCDGHYQCDPDMGNRLCNVGWGGVSCTNPTAANVSCGCTNGGTCFQGLCCCPPGFTGQFCETSLQSFCANNPCRNQGTCYEDPTGYLCVCPSGYTGENCETSLITTTALPVCPQNFYGHKCTVFCIPQDSCTDGQYWCHPVTGEKVCRFGWMGAECNVRDPAAKHEVECPDSVCRNGGVCANNTCCCPIGFTGSLCHIEILECASDPCQNGGRCHDMIGDYLCQCKYGYSGKNCESLIDTSGRTTTVVPDPCQSVTCRNNGSCYANGTVAVCLCLDGYRGDRCEEAVVFSTTTLSPGQTACPENYYGPNCQVYCKEEDSCQGGHYYCDLRDGAKLCRSGWIGDICNTRILSPELDPECPAGGSGCLNIGQCFNHSCCCPRGFKGEFCQQEVLPCETKPCTGNRICLDLVSGYSCLCHPDYEGENCDIYIGSTTTIRTMFTTNVTTATTAVSTNSTTTPVCGPCLNGGECFSNYCYCFYPFTGEFCESSVISNTSTGATPSTTAAVITGSVSASVQESVSTQESVSLSTKESVSTTESFTALTSETVILSTKEIVSVQNNTSTFTGYSTSRTVSDSTSNSTDSFLVSNQTTVSVHSSINTTISPAVNTITNVTKETPELTTNILTSETTETNRNTTSANVTTSVISSSTLTTSQTNQVVQTTNSSKGQLLSSKRSTTSPTTVSTTTASTTVTTTYPPTTLEPFRVDEIFFRGNISNNQQAIIESILHRSLNKSMNESGCCIEIQILDKTTYVDPLGNIIVGYTYNVTNSTGSSLSSLGSPETQNYYNNVDNELRKTRPFSQTGVTVYRGPSQNLNNLDKAYTISFDGELKDGMITSVEESLTSAWQKRDPNCQCKYQTTILTREPYVGDYGTELTRVYYLIKRDGQTVNPRTTSPPQVKQVNAEVSIKKNLNMAYEGSTELPYSLHYSVRLDRNIQLSGNSGQRIRQALQNAWQKYARDFTNLCTPVLCHVRLFYKRPIASFTQTGNNVSEIDYFVTVNGRQLDPVQFPGPSTIFLKNEQVPVCDCEAGRIPFIDVSGTLTWDKAQNLARDLLKARGQDGDTPVIHRENHIDSDGKPATRLYYRPRTPVSVMMFPLPESSVQSVLTARSFQPPALPLHRAYTIYLSGNVRQENLPRIQDVIREAWNNSNPDIPKDLINVNISQVDSSYYGENGNSSVTKVVYTVAIHNADSGLTNAAVPTDNDVDSVSGPDVSLCLCVGRERHELTVTGTVNENNTNIIETTLGQAWLGANPDFKGTIAVSVRSVQEITGNGNSNGQKRITYTVTTSGTPAGFTEQDLNRPSTDKIKTRFNDADVGVTVDSGSERNPDDNNEWAVPVGVVLGLLLLIIIVIVVIIFVVRNIRKRKQRNLEDDPLKFNERNFDKNHFTTTPVFFDNDVYSHDDHEEGFYVVNAEENGKAIS